MIKGHPLGRAPEVKTERPEASRSCLGKILTLGSSRGRVWKWGSPPGARPTVSAGKAPGGEKKEGREGGRKIVWEGGGRKEEREEKRKGEEPRVLKKDSTLARAKPRESPKLAPTSFCP